MTQPIDKERARELVRGYFAGVTAGKLPADILHPDLVGWTTHRGAMPGADYCALIPVLASICKVPLAFTIDAITVEDDRAVAEARSVGTLIDGTDYRQTYVFAFRFRDDRIVSIAEHYNALVVEATMMPLLTRNA
ncbi:MAG: nuclear transport factor 2 family protein [Sphingomonadales bacterium]|nr:nuclear transport factor 2 family protein [Sphingomonadales bacterium]